MSHQNWNSSVLTKKKPTGKELERTSAYDSTIQPVHKTVAPKGSTMTGKQMHEILESESMDVPTVSLEFKKAMAQARLAKGLKQKDLAFKIGVKETLLSAYENGKIAPDNQTIQKIEKVLEVKLPRMKKPKLNS